MLPSRPSLLCSLELGLQVRVCQKLSPGLHDSLEATVELLVLPEQALQKFANVVLGSCTSEENCITLKYGVRLLVETP